jgi:aryl-alcohol dehydrogenase-like predicted oxidoreductase
MNGRPTAAAAGKIDVGGDLTVNRLGFGAMRITGPGIWGDPPDRSRAIQALRRVVELDVTFIDTADSYGPEVSEHLIAEALYPYPEELVIATKGGLVRPSGSRCRAAPKRNPSCLDLLTREAAGRLLNMLGKLRKRWRPEAAMDGWEKVCGFFSRHLSS